LGLENVGFLLKLGKKWKLFFVCIDCLFGLFNTEFQIDLFDTGFQIEIDFDILNWIFGQVLPRCLTARSALAGAQERRGGYCHESRSRACDFTPRL
jgi:hypothetical protein